MILVDWSIILYITIVVPWCSQWFLCILWIWQCLSWKHILFLRNLLLLLKYLLFLSLLLILSLRLFHYIWSFLFLLIKSLSVFLHLPLIIKLFLFNWLINCQHQFIVHFMLLFNCIFCLIKVKLIFPDLSLESLYDLLAHDIYHVKAGKLFPAYFNDLFHVLEFLSLFLSVLPFLKDLLLERRCL